MVWFSLVSVFVFNVQTNSWVTLFFLFLQVTIHPLASTAELRVFLSRCVRSHSDVCVFSLMFLLFMDVCLFSFLVLSCFALAYA